MKRITSVAILLMISLHPCGACAQTEEQITVQADRIVHEEKGDTVTASGNVRIDRQDLTLHADSVTLDNAARTALAEGHVVAERRGDILRGERVFLNFETKRGVITHAFLETKKGGIRVRGDEIEKKSDADYHVIKGSFTTCEADPPPWKFSASAIDVGEKFASGRHVLFYISDVPVLYFPYLLFPISRERESGFLIPRFGTSSKKGFFLEIPYYLNLSPSQEATITLDIETKRGVGTSASYRYLRPNGGSGTFNGFLIYDFSQDRFRGDLTARHQEYFSPTLSFKYSVELATDQDFFRDFGETSGDYNRQLLDSWVFLTKNGEFWSLTPEIRYVYDLQSPNNTRTLQQLPTVTFTGIKRPILDPLFFSLQSEFTNFYREKGLKGQRFRVTPLLTLYSNPVPYVETSFWAGYSQWIYNAYGAPSDGGTFFGIMDTGASVSSTLTRVYDVARGSLERVRHVLIPEISYRYVDALNNATPPFFDYTDTLNRQSIMTWSLTTYLNGRFGTVDGSSEYRELLYLRLSQGYDFRESGRDLLNPGDQLRPFSDVRMDTRISPQKNLEVNADARFNVYDARFSSADVTTGYREGADTSVSLGYHFARSSWDYVETRLGLHLANPLYFNYTGRYSIDGGRFLENSVSLEYRHQCWGITLSYQDRTDATQFFVSFSLAGLGSIGKIKAF